MKTPQQINALIEISLGDWNQKQIDAVVKLQTALKKFNSCRRDSFEALNAGSDYEKQEAICDKLKCPDYNIRDFYHSLDAMAKARNTLTKNEQIEYVANLWKQNPASREDAMKWNQNALSQEIWWTLSNATSEMHTIAFCRTRNLNVD